MPHQMVMRAGQVVKILDQVAVEEDGLVQLVVQEVQV